MNAQWLPLLYTLLICFGSGTLVFLGISEVTGTALKSRKAAALAAALLLLLGGAAFFFSVGKPAAAIAVATNAVKGSPKSLEFVGTVVCLVVAVAYAVVAFRAGAYEEDDEIDTGTAGKVLGIVALLCGIALPLLSGHSAALGRPTWTGVTVPVAYLGNALAMGGALFASIMALRGEDASDLRKFALFGLIAAALQAVAFVMFAAGAEFVVDVAVFWIGAIVVGCVVPIVCMALVPKTRALAFAALAGSVVGGICIRLALSAIGTTSLGLIANAASRTPIH